MRLTVGLVNHAPVASCPSRQAERTQDDECDTCNVGHTLTTAWGGAKTCVPFAGSCTNGVLAVSKPRKTTPEWGRFPDTASLAPPCLKRSPEWARRTRCDVGWLHLTLLHGVVLYRAGPGEADACQPLCQLQPRVSPANSRGD